MKAWFLYVPTRHNTQQPVQDSVHNETTGNIDSNIKLQKSAQRLVVFSANRLHAHNVFQIFSLGYIQRVIGHKATHLGLSKHAVQPYNRTTIARKAIPKHTVHSKDKTYKKKPPRLTLWDALPKVRHVQRALANVESTLFVVLWKWSSSNPLLTCRYPPLKKAQ